MITIRRALPVVVALSFVLASCGGSSDGQVEDVDTSPTTPETTADATDDLTEGDGTEEDVPVDTVAESGPEASVPTETATTDPVEPETTVVASTEPVDEPIVGDAATDGIDVVLDEWAIDAPTEYVAGDITFNASNVGGFPHELVVIEGEGYEALPRLESGAVDEDNLPTGALIGRTDRVGGGSSASLAVTLAPGNYVLVCNLGGGGNSHAGQGQRLDITVS